MKEHINVKLLMSTVLIERLSQSVYRELLLVSNCDYHKVRFLVGYCYRIKYSNLSNCLPHSELPEFCTHNDETQFPADKY